MIRVERATCPPSLRGPDSKGDRERVSAIQAQAAGKKIKFNAYRESDVVLALREMFNKKCAYCEFNYAAGSSEDIEHFRPKGAVVINGQLTKPGYYWLAAEWSNLLPSCIDCNRKRAKEFAGPNQTSSGKANLFPIVDETHRWRSHTVINVNEQPLLLNPCDDYPDQHLEFLSDGLVRPATDATGQASVKGETSIEVFGLLRDDLVKQRAAKQLMIRAAIERALEAAEIAEETDDGPRKQRMIDLSERLLRDARAHLNKPEPYLAAGEAIFREYGIPHIP
ncbi:retron system putative HNH endonuclease [Pseudomonas viridiflava]|uniref:retron system putative HNH endonuclease n=1 Tax=Pseudomonas viridiflava TaxID=33069 RepID=UPI000F01A05A|nr:retron system putative HNH endonuclease [Pseudomonas viridiflava]QXG32818.1 TIGR02646 family protein [Pseudomonas viridiflava]